MIITDLEVGAARTAADEAAAELAEAERNAMRRSELDDETATAVVRLNLRARNLRARAEALSADQAEQQRALAERRDREQAAAKVLARLGEELQRRRTALSQRVAAARSALLAEFDEAGRFNAFVAAARAELAGCGLRVDDVDRDVVHATGVLDRIDGTGVRLGGQNLAPLDPGALVLEAARTALASVMGPHHLTVQWLGHRRGVREVAGHLAALAPDLPALAARKPTARPSSPRVDREPPPSTSGRSFLENAEMRRLQRPPADPGWEDEWRRQFPDTPLPTDAA